MQRRKFLIGTAGAAIGGSALVGSGAFSRVESQRAVNIEVARDEDAYLGLVPLDTPNSRNYVAHDDDGHLYVQIDGEGDQQGYDTDGPIGEGVNSNSTTWFDGMFEICNQGKDTAYVSIDVDGLSYHSSTDDGLNDNDDPVVDVRHSEGDDDWNSLLRDSADGWQAPQFEELELEVGDCATIQIVTQTYGVDATVDESLVEGEATIVADAPDAGSPSA